MTAAQLRVWTYWEGPVSFVQRICLGSIRKMFGESGHVHLGPNNIEDHITVPDWVKALERPMQRADFLRAALLLKYGGMWMDSDIILWGDPFLIVGNRPKAWTSKYIGSRKLPLIGVIYVPLEDDPWMKRTLELLHERQSRTSPSYCMMRSYADAADELDGYVEMGGWREFYSVPAGRFRSLWDGSAVLDANAIGIHVWWNYIRRKAEEFSRVSTLDELRGIAPHSVFLRYAHMEEFSPV